jgi:hypothetical protein
MRQVAVLLATGEACRQSATPHRRIVGADLRGNPDVHPRCRGTRVRSTRLSSRDDRRSLPSGGCTKGGFSFTWHRKSTSLMPWLMPQHGTRQARRSGTLLQGIYWMLLRPLSNIPCVRRVAQGTRNGTAGRPGGHARSSDPALLDLLKVVSAVALCAFRREHLPGVS